MFNIIHDSRTGIDSMLPPTASNLPASRRSSKSNADGISGSASLRRASA